MRIVKIKERANRVPRSSTVNGKVHKWVATECEKLVTLEMSVEEIRQLKKALHIPWPTRGRPSALWQERRAIQKPVLDSLESLPTS